MKRIWIYLVVALLLIGAGLAWWLTSSGEESPDSDTTVTEEEPTDEEGDSEEDEAVPELVTITYSDSGFSPKTVGPVPVGSKVRFINASSSKFQPASDPHPIHTDLSGFDSGSGIAPGGSYEFTFTEAGSWGFHNHLNESHTGTVVIEEANS